MLALAATAGFNVYTLLQIPRAATRVPYSDEWIMLQQFKSVAQGASLWKTVWAPYWGERMVILRLIFFADMRWASDAPLTWVSLVVECALIALFIVVAWKLLRPRSWLCFAFSLAIILNLMLSPYQAENFTWSMLMLFPLVFAFGAASFFFLALGGQSPSVVFLILAIASGSIASLAMPNGLLVWPILVAQAICLKLPRKSTAVLALTGILLIGAYAWHYQRPEMGMGFQGGLRHPVDFTVLTGLLLGGTLEAFPPAVRIAVALAGIAGAFYLGIRIVLGIRTVKDGGAERRWVWVLIAITLFLFLSAASVVAGRLGLEWLHRRDLILPQRYYTLIFAFWTAVGILMLYAASRRLIGAVPVFFWAAMFYILMFLRPGHLLDRIDGWADFFRGADAVGASILVDSPDDQWLGYLLDSKSTRDECVAFLRSRGMGIFAEQRARWPGNNSRALFGEYRDTRCDGAVEFVNRLNSGGWRVEGWAAERESGRVPDDLVIANGDNRIVGLARGGLRHRFFPGFFTDAASRGVRHDGLRRSEWLGYIREDTGPWTVYGLWPADQRICRVASAP